MLPSSRAMRYEGWLGKGAPKRAVEQRPRQRKEGVTHVDHPRRPRFMAPLVAATVLVASMPLSAMASPGGAPRAQARPAALSPRLIVLGREGGNIRPLTVSIGGDGTVRVIGPVTSPIPAPHLSKDALNGLLALAKAEGFFTM